MKRAVLLLSLALLVLLLMGCSTELRYDDYDIATEGIIDVIVISHSSIMSGREETETRYYSLATRQRISLTEEFESDEMTIFMVPCGCFECYTDRPAIGPRKVLNRLVHISLEDEEGNPVEVSAEQSKIFQRIATLEHHLINIRFIETGGETFVYLELDVNLWLPCRLYWYDRETDTLMLLHEWDAEEVVGLHLRNITLMRRGT